MEMCKGVLADSKVKCISLISLGCNKGMTYCFKVSMYKKMLHLLLMPDF